MATPDLTKPRGDKPQRSATQRIVSGAGNVAQKTKNKFDKTIDRQALRAAKTAEKIAMPFNDNIFPDLSPEEHRRMLIESCINSDNIFSDKITDEATKGQDDLRDYMFYNQLFFLAVNQAMQPSNDGSFLPGLAGGLSIIAGAALVNDDFRKHLKEHAQDSLIKYVEPFKDSAPKLWQKLTAEVESHPGHASPESLAIKLLRYQRQATDMVNSGEHDVKYVDDLLCKKTSELKAIADKMNIDWSDVVRMRDGLAKDMADVQNAREMLGAECEDWKAAAASSIDAKYPGEGIVDKIGGVRDWKETSDFEAPIDVESAAKKLLSYQRTLQAACEELNSDKKTISAKFSHLEGKEEDAYFASSLQEVAELKAYCEKVLGLDWSEIASRYDEMNKELYDANNDVRKRLEKYIDPVNQNEYLPNGEKNPNYGMPNANWFAARDAYYAKAREMQITGAYDPMVLEAMKPPTVSGGKIKEFVDADQKVQDYIKYMYYELPVDSRSAGRCLKKYQQEAYMCVRGIGDTVHKPTDSAEAYGLAKALCKNVRAAADVLKFDWSDSVKEYRKDVFATIKKDPTKKVIWQEICGDDIIPNIPTTKTTYATGPDGKTIKKVTPLDRHEQIAAWDAVLYNQDGSRVADDVMMRVRNPYTEEEASNALYNLFVSDFKLSLQITAIQEQSTGVDDKGQPILPDKEQLQIKALEAEKENIAKKRDDLVVAFLSDHFSPDLIARVEKNATKWFEETKSKMMEQGYADKQHVDAEEVKLDESLAPDDDQNDGPDNSISL